MYWHYDELAKNDPATMAATTKYELAESGLLSGISIVIGTQTAASYTAANKKMGFEYVDKVEVIADGNKTILSLTGREAMAFFAQNHGRMPAMKPYDGLSKFTYYEMTLFFGRYLKDKEYMLDLGKFNRVDLKITNSASTTHFTTGEFKYTVTQIFAKDHAGPIKGYFKRTEQKYWTSVATSWENTKLPVNNKIREILISEIPAYSATGDMSSDAMYNYIRELKLQTRNGDRIYINQETRQVDRILDAEAGVTYETGGVFYGISGLAVDTFLGYVNSIVMCPADAGHTIIPSPESMDYVHDKQAVIKDAAASYVRWYASGCCPFNSVCLHFDRDNSGEDLLDSVAEQPVEMKVYTKTASATIYLAISELITT